MFRAPIILKARTLALPPQGSMASFSAPVFAGAVTAVNKGNSGTSHTFTAAPTGTADNNRYNIVGIPCQQGTITAVTINSVTCQKIFGPWWDSSATNPRNEWWITSTPNTSGTTGDIVITYSLNTMSDLGAVVYACNSPSMPIITGACSAYGSFVNATATPLVVPSGGAALWVGNGTGAADGGKNSFGGTSVVKDYAPASGNFHCCASRTVAGLIQATMDATTGGNWRVVGAGISVSDPTGWSNSLSFGAMTTNKGGWSGFTLRMIIPAAAFSTNGTQCRVVFNTGFGPNNTLGINKAYFGQQAAAGDTIDMATANQLLFAGAANPGSDVAGDGWISSDALSFAIDKTKNHVLSMYISGGGNVSINAAAQTGVQVWYKNADEAATADVVAGGYTQDTSFANVQGVLRRIEVA